MIKLFNALVLCVLLSLGAGCENSLLDRSLVFATHTTMGVEVSVNPAESTSPPVKLIIGYKRSEGVLNPVYDRYGVIGPVAAEESGYWALFAWQAKRTMCPPAPQVVQKYRPDAYSVIAKFEGQATGQGGGAEAAMALSQWFATGKAAETLAEVGAAAALTDDPKVAAAVSEATAAHFGSVQTGEVLGLLEEIAALLRKTGEPQAQFHAGQIEAAAMDVMIPSGLTFYIVDPSSGGFQADPNGYTDINNAPQGTARLRQYHTNLDESIKALARVVDGSLQAAAPPAGQPPYTTQLVQQQTFMQHLREQIFKDKRVVGALKYLCTEIIFTK